MITNCSFCQVSTAGQHEADCPMYQFYTTTFVTDAMPTITRIGWECPICGCAWAPWVSGCEKCNKHDRVFDTMDEMIKSMDPTKEIAKENDEDRWWQPADHSMTSDTNTSEWMDANGNKWRIIGVYN